MPRDGTKNLIPFSERTEEEQKEIRMKGGIASGEARRAKRDMRERMKMMLEEKPKGKDYTYADRLTESMLTIAANPKNGAAAVRAYETILHIIGQDEPDQVAVEISDETVKAMYEYFRQEPGTKSDKE